MNNTGISTTRSIIPFGIFVVSAIVLSCFRAMSIELLVAAGIIGLLTGCLLAHEKEKYWNTIFEFMGSTTAMSATLLWLLVSIYGNVLKSGHIVEGLVWATNELNMSIALFTSVVFLFSALFAISTGSGFGTISSMSITLFPAGMAIGADSALLGGAILSGAALGDSIAPVSDTAIIAASTQTYGDSSKTADIGGSVKHRLPIALLATTMTFAAYWMTGHGEDAYGSCNSVHTEDGDWRGLALLIPTFVVIALAFRKVNIFISLFIGIALSILIGLPLHLFTINDIISISGKDVGGAVVTGISSMSSICILLIVVVSLSELVIKSGFMEEVIQKHQDKIIKNRRDAELEIFVLSSISGIMIAAVNTIANISVAPIINHIGNKHHIHPYRRTTILALSICTFPFIVPYGGCVLLLLNGINSTGFGSTIQPHQLLYSTFYPLTLLVCVIGYCLFSHRERKNLLSFVDTTLLKKNNKQQNK